jgi:uncharacterized protein (TIGR03067 family)
MTDQEAIQGTWSLTSGERHGKPFSEEVVRNVKLVFAGGTMTTKNGDRASQVTFKLNEAASPGEIDVIMDGQKGQGLYALDGDTLTILHGEVGDARPATFDARVTPRLTLLVLRREGP